MTMSEGITYYGSLRRFFEEEWYIPASEIGISYWEFWDMNPRIMAVRSEAYERQVRQKDTQMWQMGQYIFTALGVVLGNAFRKKGAVAQEYPKKPFMSDYFALMEDPEKNERLAALEMEQWARMLSRGGVPKGAAEPEQQQQDE